MYIMKLFIFQCEQSDHITQVMNDRSSNCFAVKFCLILVNFLFLSLVFFFFLLVCLSILCVLFVCMLVAPYRFHYRFALHGSIHPSLCPNGVQKSVQWCLLRLGLS